MKIFNNYIYFVLVNNNNNKKKSSYLIWKHFYKLNITIKIFFFQVSFFSFFSRETKKKKKGIFSKYSFLNKWIMSHVILSENKLGNAKN